MKYDIYYYLNENYDHTETVEDLKEIIPEHDLEIDSFLTTQKELVIQRQDLKIGVLQLLSNKGLFFKIKLRGSNHSIVYIFSLLSLTKVFSSSFKLVIKQLAAATANPYLSRLI